MVRQVTKRRRTFPAKSVALGTTTGSRSRRGLPNDTSVIQFRHQVMEWLADGVPITLLCDLLDPAGPTSREIYTAEAIADDVRREAADVRTDEVEGDFPAAAGG